MQPPATNAPSDVTILGRLLASGDRPLSTEMARYLLGLGFTEADKARMHQLAEKNQQGTISPAELEELDGYIRAGGVLAIPQSKARQALKVARPMYPSPAVL
jgi:hypothetical protein